ncbi:MAG TPA: ATP-binding protein [Longimicrobiaceae bacterium]|jgi:type II secretory pathway predicted ATPase ExeA
MPYRARRILEEAEISLGDLAAASRRNKSTWSRFLRCQLDPEPPELRGIVEDVLRERVLPVPGDLWRIEATAEFNETEEISMQAMTLSDQARQAFRLFVAPFDPEAMIDPAGGDHLDRLYLPPRHLFVELRLKQALTKAGFVAVYGEPGSGKTTLLRKAIRGAALVKPVVQVMPANVERRKLTAMHIAAEIIRQLSTHDVPRTANQRDALAADVLREHYQQGHRVALIIDESHELPTDTIKDLKRFHELGDGLFRLLAIVLVGQTELQQRFELARNHRLREAIIRCELLHLPPMKERGAVRAYMETRFGWIGAQLEDSWEPAAVDELERRLAVHDQQLPVLIGNLANAAMNAAYRRGNPRVTPDEVADVWGASAADLQEWGLS